MWHAFRLSKLSAISLAALLVTAAWPVASMAQQQQQEEQDSGVTASPTDATEAQESADFWTNEELGEAAPIELPTPEEGGPRGMPESAEIIAPELSKEAEQIEEGQIGSPPVIDPGEELSRPITFDPGRSGAMEDNDDGTEATSPFGAFFTTRRVTPGAATTSYPYRTAGKLFFRDPRRGTNHVCSAAVLRPRLVATAGHCVTNPSTDPAGRYFFTNFLFVPAYDSGSAPYGTWTSSQQWVSNDWHLSNGSVPNRGDMAILVMRDQTVGGQTRRIGEVTGWLGWRSNALARNNVTMLGYPCNLDSCSRMIETNAGSFASGGENTFIYGSAGRGGHSGGAWIQDFGTAPAGAEPNLLGLNRLVGITSYGPVATSPKYLGASNFGSNFTNLLNAACNAAPNNC